MYAIHLFSLESRVNLYQSEDVRINVIGISSPYRFTDRLEFCGPGWGLLGGFIMESSDHILIHHPAIVMAVSARSADNTAPLIESSFQTLGDSRPVTRSSWWTPRARRRYAHSADPT